MDPMEPQEGTGQSLEYEGNAFPWWMKLIWLVFLTWFAIYTIVWFFPDLSEFLANPPLGW